MGKVRFTSSVELLPRAAPDEEDPYVIFSEGYAFVTLRYRGPRIPQEDEVTALREFAEASDTPKTPGVLLLRFVNDEVDALFGPTLLFTPEQVQAGYFDRAVNEIEVQQGDKGVIPRLANNGRRGQPPGKHIPHREYICTVWNVSQR
jgi:hypothetical protein